MKSWGILVFIFITFIACMKEKQDFSPESEIQIIVKNDQEEVINGADIRIYESEEEFHKAINTPELNYESANARAASTASGHAHFKLKPERPYFILITYYDSLRKKMLSNLGISSSINPLPSQSTIYLQMRIKPFDANILFFTTNPIKLPIDIVVSDRNGIYTNSVLNKVYIGINSLPGINNTNILVLTRQPGTYAYSAKSADGCVWTGIVTLPLGKTTSVNMSVCKMATITFYTSNVKQELLPLTVILNDVDTLGQITSRQLAYTCGGDATSALVTRRDKGLYNYLIKSRNGTCVWSGSIVANEDDCLVIKVEDCEL